MISIVVPCYNEEESLPLFYKEIKKVEKDMKEVKFEYVRSWYLDNILNIISAADKSGNAVCGDCCQFCKQKCELRNGSV